jgi:hypothetical protein
MSSKFVLSYNPAADHSGGKPWTVVGEAGDHSGADEVILENVNGKTGITPQKGIHPRAYLEVYGVIEWVGERAIIRGAT